MLFGPEKYDANFSRVRYLIGVKNSVTYVISHDYAKIKVHSYDFLPLEKKLTFHNAIILIKSFLNKDRNMYYYIIKKSFA